ncbi:MAG: septum formation family protein [Acidimicrobiia bacterium]
MAERGKRVVGELGAWAGAVAGAALAGVLLAFSLWGALGAGADRSAAAGTRLDRPTPGTATEPAAPAATDPAVTPAADPAADPATADPAGAEPATSAIGYQPGVGDCVAVLPSGGGAGGTVGTVDCTATHLFEVVGLVDVTEQFPTRPTEVEWTALLTMRCPDQLRAYIGPSYDPHGRFVLRVSAPTEAEWAAGDRTGECLVSVGSDSAGRPIPYEGAVRGAEQAAQLRPGDCVDLGPIEGLPASVVGCDQPHQLEVLSALDLDGVFEHYPSTEQWDAAAARCLPAVVERFGAEPTAVSGNPLVPVVVPIPIESWLVGRRATACAVGELDPAGALVARLAPLDR